MKNIFFRSVLILGALVVLGTAYSAAQETNQFNLLDTSPVDESAEDAKSVTAVYGISAEDYLPSVEALKRQARPQVRSGGSRPSFDLPDAFYFIGGPIFVVLLLRVLVIFLNGFEEKRREEQRRAELQVTDPE